MIKTLIFLALLVAAYAPAGAYTDVGGRYTLGPDGYGGINAFAEWGGDDHYFRPSVNTYKSDLAERKTTYSFGAGLDLGRWGAGGEIFVTPETGGYKNTGIYADLTYSLLREPEEDAVLQDSSLGLFAGRTAHEDAYSASTTTVSSGRRSRPATTTLSSAFKLAQTDYGLTAAVKAWGIRGSVRFTKTAYDKDVTAEARQLPIDIGGIGASGFPDTAVSARLRVPGWAVAPEAAYTRTTYLLDQPSSESASLGLSWHLGPAELSAGWENFNPGGGAAKSDYLSAGLNLSF